MTDNETREIKRCYGNVENQVDEILATIDTIDRNEIKARLKNATMDVKKIGYCLYGWDSEKTKIVQYDEELEEIFRYVDNKLVLAYCYFIDDRRLTNNDDELFYSKCIALAIYHMLSDEEECVCKYTNMLYGTVVELRHVVAMMCRLIMVKDIVKTHEKTLQALEINSVELLIDLDLAITKIQTFLCGLERQVKE